LTLWPKSTWTFVSLTNDETQIFPVLRVGCLRS